LGDCKYGYPILEKQACIWKKNYCYELLSLIMVNENEKCRYSLGSSLPGLANGQGIIADLSYRFSGNFMNRFEHAPGIESLTQLTAPWLNAPYMWGVVVLPLGVDCSGFVQAQQFSSNKFIFHYCLFFQYRDNHICSHPTF